MLPSILDGFLVLNPRISVEVMIDDSPVDIVEAGCDVGIRYAELLSNDMTAVPIGPARQGGLANPCAIQSERLRILLRAPKAAPCAPASPSTATGRSPDVV